MKTSEAGQSCLPWWFKPLRKAVFGALGIASAVVAVLVTHLELLQWLTANEGQLLVGLKIHMASLAMLAVLGMWVLFAVWVAVLWVLFEKQAHTALEQLRASSTSDAGTRGGTEAR